VRYDYRKLIADCVLHEFYGRSLSSATSKLIHTGTVPRCTMRPTGRVCCDRRAGVRGDSVRPEFSRIPASAAALSGKSIVSAEAFTCLYGWVPYRAGLHQGEEQLPT